MRRVQYTIIILFAERKSFARVITLRDDRLEIIRTTNTRYRDIQLENDMQYHFNTPYVILISCFKCIIKYSIAIGSEAKKGVDITIQWRYYNTN